MGAARAGKRRTRTAREVRRFDSESQGTEQAKGRERIPEEEECREASSSRARSRMYLSLRPGVKVPVQAPQGSDGRRAGEQRTEDLLPARR